MWQRESSRDSTRPRNSASAMLALCAEAAVPNPSGRCSSSPPQIFPTISFAEAPPHQLAWHHVPWLPCPHSLWPSSLPPTGSVPSAQTACALPSSTPPASVSQGLQPGTGDPSGKDWGRQETGVPRTVPGKLRHGPLWDRPSLRMARVEGGREGLAPSPHLLEVKGPPRASPASLHPLRHSRSPGLS